jgi:FkbM family methyltransferase
MTTQPNLRALRMAWETKLAPVIDTQKERRRDITALLGQVFEEVTTLLKPDAILEIGAHEATFARHMKAALPDALVVAFEANARVFEKHRSAVFGAGVDYRNLAISDERKQVSFNVPLSKTGSEKATMGSLLFDSRAKKHKTYTVWAERLDDVVARAGNVMWIDVEGACGQVLAGAERLLSECAALYVELEESPRWPGQLTADAVIALLQGHGLEPFLTDIQRQEWQHNVVFLRPGILDPTVAARLRDTFVTGVDEILVRHIDPPAA